MVVIPLTLTISVGEKTKLSFFSVIVWLMGLFLPASAEINSAAVTS